MLRRDFIKGIAAAAASIEWQFWLLLTTATAVMVVLRNSTSLWFGGSDHADYFWYARFLLGEEFAGEPFPPNWRTPGMGIFHILSGTALFDTWKGFIALFALFSVGIPICFYLMVRSYSRNLALLVGLVVVASIFPYAYASTAGSDQPFFFLHALELLLCVLYFRTPTRLLVIGIVCIAAYATIVRPVGSLIFWIFIVLALLLRRTDRRALIAASGAYVLLMTGWILWDRAYGSNGGAAPGRDGPLPQQTLATAAERRFAEAYFSASGLTHAESDSATASYPNSLRLRSMLRDYLVQRPFEWKFSAIFTPPSLFADYGRDPNGAEKLLQAIFLDRNTLYYLFIVRAAKSTLGDEAGLALLYAVASEHGVTGFVGGLRYLMNDPSQLMLGVASNLAGRNLFALFYTMNRRAAAGHPIYIADIVQPILSPDLGPATALMLKTIRRFISDYPQYWPQTLSARYLGQPDAYYQLILRDDTAIDPKGFESDIYSILNWCLGSAPAGRVYVAAALEILHRYPKVALLMIENALNLTILRYPVPLDRTALYTASDAGFEIRSQDVSALTPGLAGELVPQQVAGATWRDVIALQQLIYLIAPIFVLLLIVALPFLLRGPAMAPCVFLLLVYLYEVSTFAIFAPWGTLRYESNFYLLPLVIACIIFGQFTQLKSAQPSALRTQRS